MGVLTLLLSGCSLLRMNLKGVFVSSNFETTSNILSLSLSFVGALGQLVVISNENCDYLAHAVPHR